MKHCQRYAVRALCSLAGMLFAASAFAADADVTGLVPTLWFDFETKPSASSLPGTNKGSVSGFTFTPQGTETYQTGVTNGCWALDTSKCNSYTSKNNSFSTVGGAVTLSLVMNLGTTENGITFNLANENGSRDLIVRRGTTTGSLVIGLGPHKNASTHYLEATLEDDSSWHLVSVVAQQTGVSLYVDGVLKSSTDSIAWPALGGASRFQFGSHLGAIQAGWPEAAGGGCIDDLRIHDAALTIAQMKAIAVEYGIISPDGYIGVRTSDGPSVGKDSFSTAWTLSVGGDDTAAAAIVYGTDSLLSSPTTNALGSALSAGDYTASLTGLAAGATYWWKIVASNGVNWAETAVESFRTLDEIVPANYARRIPAVISGYTGLSTLTNFPVLVKLSAGMPVGFDYADCAEDGADIRFAASDGLVLAHEIDTWNTNGESFVWVKVPTLAGATTAFSMYYGASDLTVLPAVDPRSVWIATDHRAVWHFAADATESAQGLIPSLTDGTPSYDNTGAVGKCWQSAGSAWLQYDNDASWSALGDGSTLTISAWAKFDSSSYNYNRILSTMSTWEKPAGYELTIQNNKNQITVGSSGRSQYQKVVSPGPMDEMVYLTAVYNADRCADLYVNGVLQEHKQLNSVVQPTEAMAVAKVPGGNNIWYGKLDELRLHATAESADWVKACYDTMATSTSFAVLSTAESTDETVPRFGALAASDENGAVTFSVEIALPGWNGAVPTAVSVFYGTDGEHWTEISLGATNEVATLTGTATGLRGNTTYLWYAVATATQGGVEKSTDTSRFPSSILTGALLPPEEYKAFTAIVKYYGTGAENIPVLLRLSETAIDGFDYDDVTASGFEIVDAAGNLLPWEIDTWDETGESLIWVRLPVWENDASITVRYGAEFANSLPPASETWSNYVGVWHLNDTNSASAYGSYPNSTLTAGIDGEKAQASIADESGVFGKSVKICDATQQGEGYKLGGVFVPDSGANSPLDLGDTFVISGWFKHKKQDYYWDKMFAKRGKSNNDSSVPPTGAFVIEVGSNNAENKVSAFGNGDTYVHKNFNSTMRDTWSYLTFVYNGSNLALYQNGALCGSGTINPVIDNDGPLSFGNLTGGYGDGTGESAWCGWIDEVRLADATPSAAWIAAEYAAMANPATLSYSPAVQVDAATPELSVPTVARNADGSFTVSVVVSKNIPASVACKVGDASYPMATADAALPMTYSGVISDLPAGTHLAWVAAMSTTGNGSYSYCPTAFHAGALVVSVVSDADEGSLSPGVFRISRADADATGLPALPLDVAFSGDGLDAIVAPTVTTLTIPAGAAYVDISVTPVLSTEVDGDKDLTLTVSGTYIGLPSSGTLTVVNADYDVTVRYVATETDGGDDANHGGTPELPKKTIGAAVSSLANIAPMFPCTVHVAPGLYPNSSPIVITNAIHILGDDSDPSCVVVSNTIEASYWSTDQRVFRIDHAEALVANLTMQKGQDYGDGGNFYIGSAGGMVSNCVVEAGYTRDNGKAAGGWLEAGVVTHSVFRKNWSSSGSVNWQGNRAGVLQLNGLARAENCLFAENNQYRAVTLINLSGSSVMRNCTIVDTSLSVTNDYCLAWSALKISSGATVQNVVIAGVTNTIDGAACPPTGTVENFQNGAFDGDVTGLPEGTISGTAAEFFENYANGDYTPKMDGPLVNVGTNYDGMAVTDLAGNPRKSGKGVDIGCYECQKAPGFYIFVR